jgi:ubiquinone/menaquinone biosynthesis C-methylase UbiE
LQSVHKWNRQPTPEPNWLSNRTSLPAAEPGERADVRQATADGDGRMGKISGKDERMSRKRVYRHIARVYDLLDWPFEYWRYRPIRRTIFEGARGRILDAGAGTGRNMAFYPRDGEVVGIDRSPHMLDRARKRQAQLGVTAQLRLMDATATDFPDGHFDYVIATFLFCVLDEEDQLPALCELRRVLKPEGEIRLLEYAYSRDPWRRFIMRLWAPWVRLMYAAAFDRETTRYVKPAGLALAEQRFVFADIIKLLVLRLR